MEKKRIVVIGSSNTDMTVLGQKIPCPGETVLGGDFLMGPGGKGANQAVAAKRLGGNVDFICKVGKDIFGERNISLYEKEGLSTENILLSDKPSGIALIAVDAKAENSIIVAPGANNDISPEDIKGLTSVIADSDFLLLQLEIPMESVLEAARIAYENNVKVILNPAPAQELPEELYRDLYLILPNEHEASQMTGIQIHDRESAATAARRLNEKGVENIIITLGSAGAFLYENGDTAILSSRKVKTIDTTAAGDTFCGGVCVALSEGKSLVEAIRFANTASSLTVQRKGAQNSIPTRAEVDLLLENK